MRVRDVVGGETAGGDAGGIVGDVQPAACRRARVTADADVARDAPRPVRTRHVQDVEPGVHADLAHVGETLAGGELIGRELAILTERSGVGVSNLS
jgi:hypothetical protein